MNQSNLSNWPWSLLFYIIGLAVFGFVLMIIVSLIPIYLKQDNTDLTSVFALSRQAFSSFTVTYLLPANGQLRKRRTTVAINPQTAGADLAQAVGVPSGTVIVKRMSRSTTNGQRRRQQRDIRCDKTNRSGDAILFELALRYPSELPCQALICQIRFFIETKEKFNNVLRVNITATDGRNVNLELCRVDNSVGDNDLNVDNTNLILFDNGTSIATSALEVSAATTTSSSITRFGSSTSSY